MAQQLVIVGPRAWKPVLDAELHKLDGEDEQSLARASLRFMHDQHVGITPELCVELVVLLRDARLGRRSSSLWAPLVDRLERCFLAPVEVTDGDAHPELQQSSGIIVATGSFYFLLRVVAPLVGQACRESGMTYLFAVADDRHTQSKVSQSDFRTSYGAYSRKLSQQIQEMAADDSRPQLLWAESAFTLASLAQPRAEATAHASELPRLDAVGLAFLQRLRPDVPRREQERRLPRRPLIVSTHHRPLLHHNEGGVDGIHITRRLADLHCMLLSELLNPPLLLLERLLSSGYTALRRPPRMQTQRDVLIAGVLPISTATTGASLAGVSSALIKACWLDWVMHLSLWLQRVGLKRSELMWIEGDSFGRMQTNRCLLAHLPRARRRRRRRLSESFRNRFLTSLGWLPGCLDRHPLYSWPGKPASETVDRWPLSDGSIDALTRWAASAWKSQRDSPGWQESDQLWRASAANTSSLRLEEYGTVHLMLFLPRQRHKIEPQESWTGVLQHRFGLPPEPGFSLTVTWLPADLSDCSIETGWEVTAGSKRRHLTWGGKRGPDPEQPLETQIAGKLESAWTELLFEEMLRD
jgi:hypothetical protein